MPGKRVRFDEETWQALYLLARDQMKTFQELADEAFADLLKRTTVLSISKTRCARVPFKVGCRRRKRRTKGAVPPPKPDAVLLTQC
jgi:hypothetical protein